MTHSQLAPLKRVFKLGSLKLDDPAPNGDFDNSVRLLAKNYPQFRMSKLYEEDGMPCGDELVYELKLPPAKDNG